MNLINAIIILTFACSIATGMAVYFGVRKHHLQKKIDAIRKITEDFKEELQASSQKQSARDFHKETLHIDNLKKINTRDVDYDAVLYCPKEGTVSYYKYTNA